MGYISNITEITSKAGNELILIELAGKADLCTVIFMKKNTNIDMVKKLSNTVVRIEGSVKDGTVFGRKIERLNVTDSGYSISSVSVRISAARSICFPRFPISSGSISPRCRLSR